MKQKRVVAVESLMRSGVVVLGVFGIGVLSFSGVPGSTRAEAPVVHAAENLVPPDTSSSRLYLDIEVPSISEVRVVELLLPSSMNPPSTLLNLTTQRAEGYLLRKESVTAPVALTAFLENGTAASALVDANTQTFVDLPATQATGSGASIVRSSAAVELQLPEPMRVEGVSFTFGENTTPPFGVEVLGKDAAGRSQIVYSYGTLSGNRVVFPAQEVSELRMTLWYQQPVRLTEVQPLFDEEKPVLNKLRFLATPGQEYRLYFNAADTRVPQSPQPGQYFAENSPITLDLRNAVLLENPAHFMQDQDSDGVSDLQDNCPSIANPTQRDANNNGFGDECDDQDFDGLQNLSDNCPDTANPNQRDTDGDGIGDACDTAESRLTEQYPWLPWAGMGGALVVIVGLVVGMVRSERLGDAPVQDSLEQKENHE